MVAWCHFQTISPSPYPSFLSPPPLIRPISLPLPLSLSYCAMKTSHEWPQPPSSFKSSSMRRKLTCEALAAVDWHKPRRFESYSDGDDELTSPHTREPLGTPYQSSGYGDGKDLQSSSYGIYGYGNCKGFQSSGYGHGKAFDIQSSTENVISSNKDGKAKLSANRRVDHSSVVLQQHPAPLRLNACPFSGPLKLLGKPHPTPSIIPAHVAGKKETCFDTREPFSPEVSCLGRVRIKEKHGHEAEHLYSEEKPCIDVQKRVRENKKQSLEKNRKDGIHKASEMKPCSKASSKKDTSEKGSCLARRKRRDDMEHGTLKLFGSCSSAAVSCETAETRRERAAVLARSLTSLLEDLRQLEMENAGYVPAVPPPNSLLLMRGFGSMDKSRDRETTITHSESDSLSDCKNSLEKDLSLPDMEMGRSMIAEQVMGNLNSAAQTKSATAQEALPLSEIENNSLVQNASVSELKNKLSVNHCRACPEALALWQRRAIAKLAAIETKRPMKMGSKKPTTK